MPDRLQMNFFGKILNKIKPVESISAYCLVCGTETTFDSFAPIDFLCKRNEFSCKCCGSIARNRHLAKVMLELFDKPFSSKNIREFAMKTNMNILHTCASGAIHNILSSAKNYYVSEYYDDCVSGELVNGISYQNLEQTTFDDDFFDLIITEDILEHIARPKQACRELRRILKTDGYHIATIPVFWDQPSSVTRAQRINGVVENILPPEYHGDPNRCETGILVYTDFGQDIVAKYLKLIGSSKVFSTHGNRYHEKEFAIFNNWVFVSQKTLSTSCIE